MNEYTVEFLYDEISRLIEPSLELRRGSIKAGGALAPHRYDPPTEQEIYSFILECPFSSEIISSALQEGEMSALVKMTDAEYDEFLDNIDAWASTNNWLGADGPFLIIQNQPEKKVENRYSEKELENEEVRNRVTLYSPSFKLLWMILEKKMDLHTLNWRQFEEMIAELLTEEGYQVSLGKGTKDQGIDITATKQNPELGVLKTIWQAKHPQPGNKVGLSVVKELADTTSLTKASKGIIVTSSFLTRGALERVRQEEFKLHKIEQPDLLEWIERILRGKRYG